MGIEPKALLLGERPALHLTKHLERKGLECSFATSYSEASSCLRTQSFDFVFSPIKLSGVTLFPLMDELEGSEATLFFYYAVDQGSWWLPALRQGERCFGTSGLRPSEFISELDERIDRLYLGTLPVPRPAKPSPTPRLGSAATRAGLAPLGFQNSSAKHKAVA
jgi:hypothetical protein